MFVIQLGRGVVESLAFGPDSRMLAVPWGGDGLLLWSNPTNGTEPRKLLAGTLCNVVRFAPAACRIECRGYKTLVILAAGDGNPVASVGPPEPFLHNFQAALTPDGQAVLVSHMVPSAGATYRSRLELRPLSDRRDEAATWSMTIPRVIWDDPLFLPDRTAVTLDLSRDLKRHQWELFLVGRELKTGRQLWASPSAQDYMRWPTLSADGRLLAAWHARHLAVWRTDDPERPPVRIKNEGTKHYTGIAFHPSGRISRPPATTRP